MRIDSNHGLQPLPENERSTTSQANAAGASALGNSAVGEDQAQLSGAHVQVAALTAQASQLPEVRQQRVQALRQAIQSGSYHASPQQVAAAVFAHLIAGSAT
jgi:flagellar biosynthesis anti-sigma factor FlgM